jgi:hypothetical protein
MAGRQNSLKRASVDGVFQAFASLELGLFGSRNLDRRARPRVAASRSFPIRDTEGAESNQADSITTFKRSFDIIENCVHGLGCVGFGKTGVTGDGRNKIVLIHCRTPFWTGKD